MGEEREAEAGGRWQESAAAWQPGAWALLRASPPWGPWLPRFAWRCPGSAPGLSHSQEGSVLGRLGWPVTLPPGVQGQLSEAQLGHRRVGSSSPVPAL